VLEDAAVVAELEQLRRSGVAIGLTVSGTSQAETIERALELGIFDTVQATWNLHERAAEDALARAHEAGLVVLVKEALANGRLSPRGSSEELEQAAAEVGATSDALALAAVMAQPWADIVLIGAATPNTLASNLAALDITWDDALESRLAALAEPSGDYWRTRSALRWN
jgi:aryl-alcohol dehydrogenase-like predicted oxidoreductase